VSDEGRVTRNYRYSTCGASPIVNKKKKKKKKKKMMMMMMMMMMMKALIN